MTDIVTPEKRSQMMAGIAGKNTRPELLVRRGLHGKGFRYSLHPSGLAGKPDIFLRKHNVCIYIHGCFWHAHDCRLFKMPKSRTEFWKSKFEKNCIRDRKQTRELQVEGFRVAVVWECALKNKPAADLTTAIDRLEYWIKNGRAGQFIEISEESMGEC